MRPTAAGFVLLAALALGCGRGGGTPYLPVHGRVTAAGKALPGGQITFHPAGGAGHPVSAGIGGDGAYEVAVPPGEYRVTVDNTPLKRSNPAALPGAAAAMPGMAGQAPHRYVPISARYARVETSGVATRVEGGPHAFDVELR